MTLPLPFIPFTLSVVVLMARQIPPAVLIITLHISELPTRSHISLLILLLDSIVFLWEVFVLALRRHGALVFLRKLTHRLVLSHNRGASYMLLI